MNKAIIAVGVVLLLVLLGGAGYMFMNQQKSPSSPSQAMMQQQSEDSRSMQKKSLKDIMAIGQSQQCTYTDEVGENSGTMYIGSGNVRGDFQSSINGKATASHMIVDSENMYMWMDGQKQGMQFSVKAMEDASANVPEISGSQAQKPLDMNKQLDYSCTSWTVDEAVFKTPTGVEFVDYTKMMAPISGAMMKDNSGSGSTQQCAVCNGLSGEAQAQCKVSLNCN